MEAPSMSRSALLVLAVLLLLPLPFGFTSASGQFTSPSTASVDPLLDEHLRAQPAATAILTFRRAVDEGLLAELRGLGIFGGYTFRALPIVIANITEVQRA